jgi:hypothetical protein
MSVAAFRVFALQRLRPILTSTTNGINVGNRFQNSMSVLWMSSRDLFYKILVSGK